MEKQRLFITAGFGILWLSFLTIGVIKWFETIPTPPSQIVGLVLGMIFGLATCLYAHRAWDPVNLQPTNHNAMPASNKGWALPLSVGGGILLSNLTSKFLHSDSNIIISWCIVVWFLTTIGYMFIQLLLNYPKN